MSVGSRSTFSSRAKFRMPLTIERERSDSRMMRSMSSNWRPLSGRPARSSFRMFAYIRITPRGLFSSWAIPAAICPMDASFSAWIRRLWFSFRSEIAVSSFVMR